MGNEINKFCNCDNIFNNKNNSISLSYKNNPEITEKPTNSFKKEIIPITNNRTNISYKYDNELIKENSIQSNLNMKNNHFSNSTEADKKISLNHNSEIIINNNHEEEWKKKDNNFVNKDKINLNNSMNSEHNSNLLHQEIFEENSEKENFEDYKNENIKKQNNKKLTFNDLLDEINLNIDEIEEKNKNNNLENEYYQNENYNHESEYINQKEKNNDIFSLGDDD